MTIKQRGKEFILGMLLGLLIPSIIYPVVFKANIYISYEIKTDIKQVEDKVVCTFMMVAIDTRFPDEETILVTSIGIDTDYEVAIIKSKMDFIEKCLLINKIPYEELISIIQSKELMSLQTYLNHP